MTKADTTTPVPIAILAGGKSKRFGRADKATALLDGVRLVDHMIKRLAPQAPEIVLSSPRHYDTGLPRVPDLEGTLLGPAAGLYALAQHFKNREAFLTVAVDMPFIPNSYVARMVATGPTCIASTGANNEAGTKHARLHPTCGLWCPAQIIQHLHGDPAPKSPSLHRLAAMCGFSPCNFDDECAFMNLNTEADMAKASKQIQTQVMVNHG